MQLTIIGTGYVGLVSGVCLATKGHHVSCVDINTDKIKALNEGQVPIYEPGLAPLLADGLASGQLTFTSQLSDVVPTADIIMIAVGTPTNPDTLAPDLRYVDQVAKDLAPLLSENQVVVIKSTSPVGTAKRIGKLIEQLSGMQVHVATNPEFLREGAAVDDFMHPDRIVIGAESTFAQNQLEALYAPFAATCPILVTDLASAEMIKYAANAFLATKIAFINEVANLCEAVGADVTPVAKGIGLDHRIGQAFLEAGPGFGGSCFPKDTLAMAYLGEKKQSPQTVVEAVIKSNDARLAGLVERIEALFEDGLAGKTIAFWGATFKPLTDDMRDSPALVVMPALLQKGAHCVVYDPQGKKEGMHLLPGVTWAESIYEASKAVDAICVLTHWPEFREVDLERVALHMHTKYFVDFRRMFPVDAIKAAGFDACVSIGVPTWMKEEVNIG